MIIRTEEGKNYRESKSSKAKNLVEDEVKTDKIKLN